MKLKTVYKSRVPKKVTENKLLTSGILTLNIIMDSIIPFIFGYYYAVTNHLIFMFFFILIILFSIEIEPKENTINLKIKRLI